MAEATEPTAPLDPIEAEVAAAKLDTASYVRELAQSVQATLNPEAPNGDCSPYIESAQKFFAMATASQAIMDRYHSDSERLKETTRKLATERAADEQRIASDTSAPGPIEDAPAAPADVPGADPMSQGGQGAAVAVGAQTPNPQTVRGQPMPV